MGRRIWTRHKTKPHVIALNCYYPSTHPSDSPATVIPSSSGLMEEPGKTPRSPTRTWQAIAVGCLIALDSIRNSSLHTSPWQPWFLSSPLTLTSGEHLLPCWWQPAAGGFHWETPWQWHRWRGVNLGGKSQVSFANKQLEEAFCEITGCYRMRVLTVLLKPWVEGGDQLCVPRAIFTLKILQLS